jgi:nucleotide-binding universal stress UspA family protein
MFNQLLLAIDDSPGSETAVAFATAFARHHEAAVHVFSVNEYLVGGRGVTLLTRAEATELLAAAVAQLSEAGVRATGSSVSASYREVPRCIATAAHERAADAIVLGSERHQRLGRLFSPNVRVRTIRLTSLPVIAAPAPLAVAAGSDWGVDDLARMPFEVSPTPPSPRRAGTRRH